MNYLLKMLSGPIGSLLAVVLTGAIGTGLIGSAYFHWKNQIRAEAIAIQNTRQLEKVVEGQQKAIEDQKKIQAELDNITKTWLTQKDEINTRFDTIGTWLSQPETMKGDRPSSNILKETIRRLGK